MLKSQSHDLQKSSLDKIGELTDGYSGADMANLAKEAAMGPIRSLDYSQIGNPNKNVFPTTR